MSLDINKSEKYAFTICIAPIIAFILIFHKKYWKIENNSYSMRRNNVILYMEADNLYSD